MLRVTLFFIPLLGVRLVDLWRQLTHLTLLLGVKFDTLAYAGRNKITFSSPVCKACTLHSLLKGSHPQEMFFPPLYKMLKGAI